MYTLIEYNNSYKENLKQLKKDKLTPVVLFKLKKKKKNQTKEDIQKIKDIKQKINPNNCAIQITIEKLENSSTGIVNSLKNDFDIVIGMGGLNKINRFFLEQTQIDFLQDPHNTYFKSKIDFIHHFNSGINHVLGTLAKERNIGFLFTLNFTQKNKRFIPKEIGRINQNIRFARKYKIPTIINFIIQTSNQIKTKEEIKLISSIFDISTQQKEEGIKILENKTKHNKQKKTKKYITKGIKFE